MDKIDDYEDDVIYAVWRWGGNPDLVDSDRVEDHFYDDLSSDKAAFCELKRQRQNQQFHEHGSDNPPHPSKRWMDKFYRR